MTTKKPGKNRLSQRKAPIHVKRKRIRARLLTNDPNLQNIPIRTDEGRKTADGKEEAIPIHPSNLVVTALYEGDPVRIKQLIERGGGVQE